MANAETIGKPAHDEIGPQFVGPWLIEQDSTGTALRRADPATRPEAADPDWDPIEFVPAAGDAQRVVVLGESTARGWPFEPFLSPTSVLGRNLTELGAFQCVDLSKVGADGDLLAGVAEMLPAVAPDVVVSLAGNNWMMPAPTGDRCDDNQDSAFGRLATGLRTGGWPGLKAAGTREALVLVDTYLDRLLHLHRTSGARIVMVVMEFNLVGFVPPEDVQTPVMTFPDLERWHRLKKSAELALAARDLEGVVASTSAMTELDNGCSPLPGWLAGQAAISRGDGVRARAALEHSRDAVAGLMLRYTPRVTRAIQDRIVGFADAHGFACVDLRSVLADPNLPDVPDVHCFHDYCHLSDSGIERAVAAITDALAGLPAGTTAPGPGLPSLVRAFGHARAAAHLAFQAQPAAVVATHVDAALSEEPALAPTLADVRDLLSAPAPGWTEQAMGRLLADPRVGAFVGAMTGRPALAPEHWILRRCLDDRLGIAAVIEVPPTIDLLTEPEADGHPLPNWTDSWAHHVSCSAHSALAFALDGPRRLELSLELRARWSRPGATVAIGMNDVELTTVLVQRTWTTLTLAVPASMTHRGTNEIHLRWPVPDQDPDHAIREDADTLDRGGFPMVLPVYGELYRAELRTDGS